MLIRKASLSRINILGEQIESFAEKIYSFLSLVKLSGTC